MNTPLKQGVTDKLNGSLVQMHVPLGLANGLSLLNTSLQRGDSGRDESRNRFSGLG